ncbi:MAG: acyltransferase [Fibrobacterales bacterium]
MRKIESLEGVRGFAAFTVLIYHLQATFYGQVHTTIENTMSEFPKLLVLFTHYLVTFFTHGEYAVYLFWTLSGFVLSLKYFKFLLIKDESQARNYIKSAFVRRYPRLLLPVLGSVMFAWLLLKLDFMYIQSVGNLLQSEWLRAFYTVTPDFLLAIKSGVWDSFFTYSFKDSYNSVLWTIEIEMYGSIVLFLFLYAATQIKLRLLGYLLSFVVGLIWNVEWVTAFVMGAALCELYVFKDAVIVEAFGKFSFLNSRLGSIILSVMLFFIIVKTHHVGLYILSISFILLLLIYNNWLSRLFALAPFRFFGRISFGLYIMHWPVNASVACGVYLLLNTYISHFLAAIIASLTSMCVSIVLGYVVYKFLDLPAVTFSRTIEKIVRRKR